MTKRVACILITLLGIAEIICFCTMRCIHATMYDESGKKVLDGTSRIITVVSFDPIAKIFAILALSMIGFMIIAYLLEAFEKNTFISRKSWIIAMVQTATLLLLFFVISTFPIRPEGYDRTIYNDFRAESLLLIALNIASFIIAWFVQFRMKIPKNTGEQNSISVNEDISNDLPQQ